MAVKTSPYFQRHRGLFFPISVPRKTFLEAPVGPVRALSTEYYRIRRNVGGGQVYITVIWGSFSHYLAGNMGQNFPLIFGLPYTTRPAGGSTIHAFLSVVQLQSQGPDRHSPVCSKRERAWLQGPP